MPDDLPDEVGKYEYYLLGTSVPIRVAYDRDGYKMGAEVPDEQTGGLAKKATYLSIVETSPDVEEISREQFDLHCAAFFQKKSPRPHGLDFG